jgi:type VI secretion system protein VasD
MHRVDPKALGDSGFKIHFHDASKQFSDLNDRITTLKTKLCQIIFISILALILTGCAAAGAISAIGSVASTAMQAMGVKKDPEVPDSMKAPRTVAIKLHAADALNVDQQGRPLALVVKIYKLRQNAAFQQASYDTFLSAQKEKELLGADLLEVKEITLIPGQRYEISEKVTREAAFIGVVAQFRNPAPSRWRVAFPAADAEKSGITVGLFACSVTVGAGVSAIDIQGKTQVKNEMVAPVRCP